VRGLGGHPMSDSKLLALASSLRARAKEILAKAETMTDADAREMMRAVAAAYERLTDRLEKEG
jgi:hypothetical protein